MLEILEKGLSQSFLKTCGSESGTCSMQTGYGTSGELDYNLAINEATESGYAFLKQINNKPSVFTGTICMNSGIA